MKERFSLQQRRKRAGNIPEDFQSWATAPSIGCLERNKEKMN